MKLRQWTTNSTILNDQARNDKTNAEPTVKILGLVWNAKADTLSISLANLSEEIKNVKKVTKRSALSLSSKLFDPLGFVEPITVKTKIMMQQLWKQNVKWDEILPKNVKESWIKWLNELSHLELVEIVIPRPYFKDNVNDIQFHVFCDSSKLAYGTVAYLRANTHQGTKSTYVTSKSKVAPVKHQAIPRLELLAAHLGAELANYLSTTVLAKSKPPRCILWSDSKIALSWISSTKHLHLQFVRHRVQLIRDLTLQSTWRYCPTASNPADHITRGIEAKTFILKSQDWRQGPPWLTKPEGEWPSVSSDEIEKTAETEESPTKTSTTTNLNHQTFFFFSIGAVEFYFFIWKKI